MIRNYGQFLRGMAGLAGLAAAMIGPGAGRSAAPRPVGTASSSSSATSPIHFVNGHGPTYGPMGQAGYRADPSPVVVNNGSTMSSPSPSFPRNANGQTYGFPKGLPPSQWPDLVLVQDTAGQVGYAYKSQLNSEPTTLGTAQQAAAHNARLAKGYTIPVYDSNGTTVIGQFKVGGTAPTFIPAQSAGK